MGICESTISGRENTSKKVYGGSDVTQKGNSRETRGSGTEKKASKNMVVDQLKNLQGPSG